MISLLTLVGRLFQRKSPFTFMTSSSKPMLVLFFGMTIMLVSNALHFDGIREMKKKLHHDIITNYGPTTFRPVKNDSTAVRVGIRMLVDHLVEFDEPQQQVTIFCAIKMIWRDEYLTWNESDYGGLSVIEVDVDQIWTPAITLLTSNSQDFLTLSHRRAFLSSNGDIDWLSPAVITSSCIFDVYLFPFDIQRCVFEFAPWSNSRNRVDFFHFYEKNETTVHRYRNNGVWEIKEEKVEIKLRNYSCCDESFAEVYYSIAFRRESKVYILGIIIPSLLLSLSTVLIFMLPPESGEKISFGITNLLAMILFLETVRAAMPATGSPALANYICAMVVLACSSLAFEALVLRMYSRDDVIKAPGWLFRAFIAARRMSRAQSHRNSTDNIVGESHDVIEPLSLPAYKTDRNEENMIPPKNSLGHNVQPCTGAKDDPLVCNDTDPDVKYWRNNGSGGAPNFSPNFGGDCTSYRRDRWLSRPPYLQSESVNVTVHGGGTIDV
ncbi:neuronal acetylcholine receptor subunit alpha-7-like [Diadema antillarum]|uniref:neuronal acetylcholine receptor subunit alpha-7-like n=1 Tax=Diadema antillarum TaxID=105358 RepID=UPI003A8501FE